MLESFLGTLLSGLKHFPVLNFCILPNLSQTYFVLTVLSPKTRHTSALITSVLLTIASSELSLDAILGAR